MIDHEPETQEPVFCEGLRELDFNERAVVDWSFFDENAEEEYEERG